MTSSRPNRDRLHESDELTYALVGLAALGADVVDLAAETGRDRPVGTPVVDDTTFHAFLLGLAKLGETVDRLAEEGRASSRPRQQTRPPSGSLRDLLR